MVRQNTHIHTVDPTYSTPPTGGLAGHRSMIMYMLSKIRIGMDLSRVALPAFILEKRSTLELYADFLTHSQLFAK